MSILLQVSNLTKSYDIKPLFKGLTLSVSSNQHIGVIGRNGAGKSTLFKIIMDIESTDSGEVHIHDNTKIGYIRQQKNEFSLSETVIEFLLKKSKKEEWECAKMAAQFQIKGDQLNQKIGSFAGGYQMRIKIIAMLLKDPNLLLLDEPTNYLDLSTLLLLEQFLQTFSGSFLLISHDREFIKRTCKQTLEIANQKANFSNLPLEQYLEYKIQQEEFAKRHNKKIARQQRHLQTFVDRFRYKASKASQAQSKLKQIDRLKQITIDTPSNTAQIIIPKVPNKKGTALLVKNMSIGYPKKTVATDINFHIDRGEHIAIVGNNGQGKSTLLKTITQALSPLEGSYKFSPNLKIGYYAQHVPEMLNKKDNVQSHLESIAGSHVSDEQIFQMAGNFLFHDDDLKKSISVLSGGEKARLCLAGLLLQKNDVLLLDEPTNHLDFETVEALAEALSNSNATILFVSHNRTFVTYVATSIIEVNNGKVTRSYHNYENYVYHLKETLQIEKETKKENINNKKEKRIKLRKILKEEKNKLHELEIQSMETEKRKQKLLDWFEKNHGKYSKIKQDQLNDNTHELHQIEQTWFETQENIQKIEEQLQKLK